MRDGHAPRYEPIAVSSETERRNRRAGIPRPVRALPLRHDSPRRQGPFMEGPVPVQMFKMLRGLALLLTPFSMAAVANADTAPSLSGTPDRTALVGSGYTFQPRASDADGGRPFV